MKKFKLMALSLLSCLAANKAMAAITLPRTGASQFGGFIANETGLASTQTYTVDMTVYDGSRVSAQINYGSTTFASKGFNDGQQSTGSLTVISQPPDGFLVQIGTVSLASGTSFFNQATLSKTAVNLSTAINANASLSTVLVSSVQAGQTIIFATATQNGIFWNLPMTTQNSLIVSVSSPNMNGGQDSAFSIQNSFIRIPSHGFTLALDVLFSTNGNVGQTSQLNGLTNQTTYFVIPIDRDSIRLATTTLQAVSNQPIVLWSSGAAHTAFSSYTITALPLTGSTTFFWQVSNDATNYMQLNVSSFTVPPVLMMTSMTTVGFDFGPFNWRFLRLNAAGPTTGGAVLQTHVNVKGDNR